jgi:HSP20 family protein
MAGLIRRGTQVPERSRASWDPFQRMREMMQWDPFREIAGLAPYGEGAEGFIPNFEVKETKDSYVVKADLPGVKESDLDIALSGDRLTISGKREAEKEEEQGSYYTYEMSYGTFTRSFQLPEGVDTTHADAKLKDGVLQLVLPKKQGSQSQKIPLNQGKAKA